MKRLLKAACSAAAASILSLYSSHAQIRLDLDNLSGRTLSTFTRNTVAPVQAAVPIDASESAELLRLLFENREAEAVDRAAGLLLDLVPVFLEVDPQKRATFESSRNVVQFLRVYELADKILAKLGPKPDMTLGELRAYAAVAEMLGKHEIALQSYSALLERQPDDAGVRGRLALLSLAEGRLAEAEAALSESALGSMAPLGMLLSSEIQSINENEFDRRLDYVTLLAVIFERANPEAYLDAPWLLSLLDIYLGQANYGNIIRFGDLYHSSLNYNVGYESPEQEARSRAIEGRRFEVHERLCRALLQLPQFAEIGFQRLSGLATRSDDISEYEALALELLLSSATVPERPADLPAVVNPYQPNFHEHWVPFLSPAEFLLRSAVDQGDFAALQTQVIPALEAGGKDQTVAFLRDMIALGGTAGSDFVTKATEILGKGYAGVEPGNLMRRIMAMFESQGNGVDQGPLILAYLDATRNRQYVSPSYVHAYGATLAESGDMVAFIEKAEQVLLGDADQREAFIKQHHQPNTVNLESPGNAVRNYVGFLSQMIQGPGTAAIPLKRVMDLGLTSPNDYQIRNALSNNLRYYQFRNDPQGVFQFVQDMGFLNDVDTIEFYPMANVTRETLFGHLIYNLCRVDEGDKDRVLAPIRDYPQDTFGKAILLATATASSSSSSQREAMTRALEPFMDRILALPKERQDEIAYWYAFQINQNSLNTTLKTRAPKVAQWYEPKRSSGELYQLRNNRRMGHASVASLEQFLAAEKRDAFDQQSGLDYTAQQIAQTFSKELTAEEMGRFIAHYVRLAGQPNIYQPGVVTEPNVGYVLSNWLNASPSMESLGMLSHALNVSEMTSGPLPAALRPSIRNALATVDFDDPAGVAATFLEKSQQGCDDRLTAYFAQRFVNLGSSERQAMLAWASKDETPLGASWRDALALAGTLDASGEARWVERLSDTEKSLETRLAETDIVSPLAVSRSNWGVVKACLAVYEASWSEGDEGPKPDSGAVSTLLQGLLTSGGPKAEAMALARDLVNAWTPNLSQTPMGPGLVENVLAQGEALEIDRAKWIAALPQAVQRQPGFLMNLLKTSDDASDALAAVPWSFLAMPPLNQRSQQVRQEVRFFNGMRQVHNVRQNHGNLGQLQLGAHRLDQALWDKTQDLMEAIEEPGARYFAELLVSALPDGSLPEGVSARADRLKQLSARYDRSQFASPYLAEHTASWLCALNEGVGENVRGSLAHFGDQVDYQELAKWYDPALRVSRQNLLNHYVQDAAKNKPDAFARLLDQMLQNAGRHNGEAQQLLETYCKEFPKNLLRTPKLLSAEEAKAYLPLLRRLAEMSREVYWSGKDECISGNFAMHVLANEAQGYQDWLKGLNQDLRVQIYSEANLDQAVFLLRDGLNGADLTDERRFQVLNGLFTGGGSQEDLFPNGSVRFSGRGDDNVFERMIDLNALKEEEILEHGPGWAKVNPRRGAAFGELAKYQAKAGQEDEAILNYLQAVIHTPMNNHSAYGRYHMEKTKLLLKQGRVDAAMSWLDFLEEGRIDEGIANQYEEIRRQTRFQYLLSPKRLDSHLQALRDRIGQDPSDAEAWSQLAEILTAMGNQRMGASDYFRGLAFLKLSYYVIHQVERAGKEVEPTVKMRTSEELKRGLVALGLGGKKEFLVRARSTWTYHYEAKGLSGMQWRQLDFNGGRAWRKGLAPLGYGDGDEATVLSYGSDKENKPITAYFRMEFEVDDPHAHDELAMGVLHDDGVIVYLNGKQLAKNNMPNGIIRPTTLAPESRGSSVENAYWEVAVPAEGLVAGKNVIAAEVHQNDPDSSDLGFDLQLVSEGINRTEVIEEVESGKAMRFLKADAERLPKDLVSIAKGLGEKGSEPGA